MSVAEALLWCRQERLARQRGEREAVDNVFRRLERLESFVAATTRGPTASRILLVHPENR
jgi:hypothetical protein